MSVYPGSLDSFSTKVDKVDLYMAAHINAVQAAIVSVETELGTDPAGSAADLKTRLAIRIANDGKIKQPQQLVTVAKANGDYTVIQNAIDSISDQGASKPYTVLLFPGIYPEAVTLKDYVSLIGIDKFSCIIRPTTGAVNALTCDTNALAANLTLADAQGEDTQATVKMTSPRCYLENCIVKTNDWESGSDSSYGIDIEASGPHWIKNVEVYSGQESGFHIWYGDVIGVNVYASARAAGRALQVGDECEGAIHFYNSIFNGGTVPPITSGSAEPLTLHHCRVVAASNQSGILLYYTTSKLVAYHCTILKHGSAINSITAASAGTDVAVALCALNAPLHGNCNNLIAAPNNVVDADVI